ncbi:hypothetical protein LB506_010257, partial [Fusarium annulatum]
VLTVYLHLPPCLQRPQCSAPRRRSTKSHPLKLFVLICLKYLDHRMKGTPHQAGSRGTLLSLLLSDKFLLNFHAFTRLGDASLQTIPAGHSNNIDFETSDHFPHLPAKRPVS